MAENFYDALGIKRNATPDEIKKHIVNLPANIIPMSAKKKMLKLKCRQLMSLMTHSAMKKRKAI